MAWLEHWEFAVVGGGLIGIASAALFVLNGRIAGVSGIFGDLFLEPRSRQTRWRFAFIVGMVLGGFAVRWIVPAVAEVALRPGWPMLVVGGLLVGFGTRLGRGCTSGHGICGISRLSRRSVAATSIFMLSAIITVALVRHGGQLA